MAGDDKETDRGHAHRSNGSEPVQAASAELARQGTEACAVYSGLQRASWDSHRFGLCSAVAELWWPDCAQHSMRGDDPGVRCIWPSENQHWLENRRRIKNWPRELSNGLLLSVSQNLVILWLLFSSSPLNPRKGRRRAQREIRRPFPRL